MKKLRPKNHHQQQELSWRRVVMRKWLNIAASDSDYSADTETESESESDSDQEYCEWPRESRFKNDKSDGVPRDADERGALGNTDTGGAWLSSARASVTVKKDFVSICHRLSRLCVGTWNVGGIVPSDDLELDGWLDIDDPADIYVIGFQEIIPLNAGNVFGAEDSRPVPTWENIIRETLNKVPPATKFKCYSDPASPSKFRPHDDAPIIEDEIALESDSDIEEEIYPVNEETSGFDEIKDGMVGGKLLDDESCISNDNDSFGNSVEKELRRESSSSKRLDRLNCSKPEDSEENVEAPSTQCTKEVTKSLSGTEIIGLSWPERPLHLLAPHDFERSSSMKSHISFKASKLFGTYNSFKSNMIAGNKMRSDIASLVEIDLEHLINRKRRPPYVRILSKQMVGVFITIWTRRSLRRHIQNVSVSAVGVGVMGFIGNKGSISVSMSIYQTIFCFVCSHLTSGEREVDAVKRNADVQEIHKRTRFSSVSSVGFHKSIYDHERVIWLGDLNYRINLSYDQTRKLISQKDWSKLIESDQLCKEFRKGRAFDGWSEGTLNFAPTYKYELNSESYCGEDPRAGRRTPAWCDRILTFGTGFRQLSYRRSELKLSDHRPVTATFLVEVEVFSPRKLQRALTFTDAEIEEKDIVGAMVRLQSGEVGSCNSEKTRIS
ncbi:type I inositol 1,4,5-trisphosphate 5-phosphatase 1-like [Dorcoceras hygrometricum]|uniref:Type I inositol 1,4,5-trisphosphate 5-phosphatase 1-like n=1 Tax=Dorcoceras hygrometricum TaxID=472368 RepID=A0A2Z7B577_9LAMI|nr:type I inositol 1,4,5-trisphosphate 5-phosphatase 1-like [Dorcoceras hygrometricum]